MELAGELNRLAGNPRSEYRGIAAAANQWAGTTDLELVGALNTKAGIPRAEWLDLRGVLRRLGFTEGGTADSATGAAGVGQLQNTLRLPGISGNYLSTPDTAATSITGDIDIRVKVALDSWAAPAKAGSFVSKWGGAPGRSFRFYVETNGVLWFASSGDGTTADVIHGSTSAPGFADGSVRWVRVTLDVDNGATQHVSQFFTSEDGVNWTLLRTNTIAGVRSIADSTTALDVGRDPAGGNYLQGHIYYAEVRSGIDGNVVAKFDSSTVAVRGDRAPTTHTQPSAAEAIRLPGVVGNYLSQPDSAANSVTGSLDLRVKCALEWGATFTTSILGKWSSTANQKGYLLQIQNGLPILYTAATPAGSTISHIGTVNLSTLGWAAGTAHWVRATLDIGAGAVKFYTSEDGVTWTQLGATVASGVTSIADNTEVLYVGGRATDNIEHANGLVYYAEVRNGIDGPVVASFNAANTVPTDMRTPATTSDGWTVNGTGWSWDAPATAPSSGAYRSPGVTGNYISTPDAADISIVGDIDLRAKVTMDDWTPAAAMNLISKWGGSGVQTSYILQLATTGSLKLYTSADGVATTVNATSSVAVGLADGATKWVRGILDVDNGAVGKDVKFYTSDDGATWTQLGTTQTTATTTSIADTTSALVVGARSDGLEPAAGYIHRAEVRNGIDGAIVASFDAANAPITGTRTPTTVVQSGRTWTVNGTAWSWVHVPDPTEWTANGSDWWWGTYTGTQRYTQAIELDEQYVYFPGTTGNYASTPDSAALSITGDIDIRAKIALDDWTSTTLNQAILSKWDGATTRSYLFCFESGIPGRLRLYVSGDGSAGVATTAASSVPFTSGATGWVRVTRAQASGTTTFYSSTDGVTWTQLGAPTTLLAGTAIADTASAVDIGRQQGTWYLAGKVYYAEIRNGIGGTVVGVFAPSGAATTAIRTPTTFASGLTAETWTLNGSAWNWSVYATPQISAPDSAALSIVGDIDLRAKVTANTLVGGVQGLVNKRDGSGGYSLRIGGTGGMDFIWFDGTVTQSRSSAPLSYTAGQTFWVRATLDVDNGAVGHDVKFYTSSDGVTWAQLGATSTTALTTAIADNTATLTIGDEGAFKGARKFMGTIHYAEIRSGIGGTVVGVFNPGILKSPYDQTPTTLKSPSGSGEVYTITGSGWRWRTLEV